MTDTARLKHIRLLLTDVDGVLTDGRILFDHEGKEHKLFHVHDAAGIVYWHRSGGITGFLSGRDAPVVAARAQELRVQEVHLGHIDKLPVFQGILERTGLAPENVAYVGDDILDLPVLNRVGFAASVPNGRQEVLERVHYVTQTAGGHGALREVIEILLKAQGKWQAIMDGEGRP